MSSLPKATYRFNAIPIKIPVVFFTEKKKALLKIIWYHKRRRIAKEFLKKKNKAGGITLPEFKLYHKLVVIKTVVLALKQTDQWDRIESPEINLNVYSLLIFDRGGRNTQWRKGNKWCLGNGLFTCKRMKLDPYLIPLTKIN